MEHLTGFEPASDISIHVQLPYSPFVAEGATDALLEGPIRFELIPQGFAVPRISHFATAPLTYLFWLPGMDSNHDSMSQSHASYR